MVILKPLPHHRSHTVMVSNNIVITNKIYREKSIPMIAWCPAFSNLG